MQGNKYLKELIQQRRRSSVKNLMTKEPIENFLGVVLKPVAKDPRDEEVPQQAQQMLKVTEQWNEALFFVSSRSNCSVKFLEQRRRLFIIFYL